MKRALLGWGLAVLALALGLSTAFLVAENRARGRRLDELQRWCEAEARTNELLRAENAREEWKLLGEDPLQGVSSGELDV